MYYFYISWAYVWWFYKIPSISSLIKIFSYYFPKSLSKVIFSKQIYFFLALGYFISNYFILPIGYSIIIIFNLFWIYFILFRQDVIIIYIYFLSLQLFYFLLKKYFILLFLHFLNYFKRFLILARYSLFSHKL